MRARLEDRGQARQRLRCGLRTPELLSVLYRSFHQSFHHLHETFQNFHASFHNLSCEWWRQLYWDVFYRSLVFLSRLYAYICAILERTRVLSISFPFRHLISITKLQKTPGRLFAMISAEGRRGTTKEQRTVGGGRTDRVASGTALRASLPRG